MNTGLKMDRKINFEIKHNKQKQVRGMTQAHYHPYYEVSYIVGGTRKCFVAHTVYVLGEGDLNLISKNEIHRSMKGDGGCNGITCSFSEEYLVPLYNTYGKEKINNILSKHVWHFSKKDRRQIEVLLHTMLTSFRHPTSYVVDEQKLFIQNLIIQLLKLEEKGQKADLTVEDIESKRMQEAARYITEHCDSDLSLGGVAATFDMSTSSFSRKFKMITGSSFKEYLIMVRIRMACNLLIQDELSITEIALKCGFNDSNYFGDAFKKVKGISPRGYRKVSGFI